VLGNAQYFKLMGQPELGIKELEDVHRLNPGNLQVADALAQYYDELGLGAQAQQIYLEALALAPDTPALQNNLCFSIPGGDWSQPRRVSPAPGRQPNNQFARNNLGWCCEPGRWKKPGGCGTKPTAKGAPKIGEALAALGMAGEAPLSNNPAQPRASHLAPSFRGAGPIR
jgi:tetratricopeptide (TPR) repeat protein